MSITSLIRPLSFGVLLTFTLSACTTGNIGNMDFGSAIGAGTDVVKATQVTDEEIKNYAKQFADHADSTSKVASSGSKYNKRLARLVNRHKSEDGLKLNYKVYLDPQVNAFALADGSIRVYSGLMDLMNDEELLSVIGHEIGHVKLGHSKSQVKSAYLTSAATKAASAAADSAATQLAASQLGPMVKAFIDSQYSKSQEEDSDDYSIKFMKKNGYNPMSAVKALNKLAKLSEGEESGFFSSHPSSESRAERLKEQLS